MIDTLVPEYVNETARNFETELDKRDVKGEKNTVSNNDTRDYKCL